MIEWIVGAVSIALVALAGWLGVSRLRGRRADVLRDSAPPVSTRAQEVDAQIEARELGRVVAQTAERRAELDSAAELEGEARTDAVTDLLRGRR